MLSSILKKTKQNLESDNEIFIRAMDQRMKDEFRFLSSVQRLRKMPDTAIEVLSLHDELYSSKTDDPASDKKSDMTFLKEYKERLDKELNLSRKRLKRLEDYSHSFRLRNVVEVFDSPPQTDTSDDNGRKSQSWIKVSFSFDFITELLTNQWEIVCFLIMAPAVNNTDAETTSNRLSN